MSLARFKLTALAPAACLFAAVGGTMLPALPAPQAPQAAAASDEGRKPARHDLTPQSFATLHRLIRAQDNEWRHLKVHWHTDIVAARKKAAREDKPIIIVYTMGAGYNDPLGIC